MLRLHLLRHAKSSWAEPGLSDHDRPLNARGTSDAPRMGAYIAEHVAPLDLILCSTAVRARQTLELILPCLREPRPDVIFEDSIYEVPPSRLATRIRQLPEHARSVMIIGHNPGMHGVALDFTGAGDTELVRELATKYPTCGLATLEFDLADWSSVRRAAGRLVRFVKPKTLAA